MKKKSWFVYVPKKESHAAFVSQNDAIANDSRMQIVSMGLTLQEAKRIAMKIRRG